MNSPVLQSTERLPGVCVWVIQKQQDQFMELLLLHMQEWKKNQNALKSYVFNKVREKIYGQRWNSHLKYHNTALPVRD